MIFFKKRFKRKLERSNFFDKKFYLRENRDARLSKLSAIDHYIKIGMIEDRKPNINFDPVWYRNFYKDIAEADIIPIIHFILYGNVENRFINKNEESQYQKIKLSGIFDENFYKTHYDDLKEQQKDYNFLLHYIRYGESEGRKPNKKFDPLWYNQKYLNQKGSHVSPLIHFIENSETHFMNSSEEEKQNKLKIIEPSEEKKIEKDISKIKSVEKVSTKKNIRKVKPKNSSTIYKFNLEKINSEKIVGWIVNLKKPNDIFNLTLYIDDIEYISFFNDKNRSDLKKHKLSAGKGGFEVLFPKELLTEKKHKIALLLPDKTTIETSIENETTSIDYCVKPIPSYINDVTIIVPIYNAADDLEVCIDRLLTYTTSRAKLILINDASTDKRIPDILSNIPSDKKNIKVLHNVENLGFTRTVKRGIKEAGDDDVILLNSDARVTPYWLEGLKKAINSDLKIATVTPMSDRAGAFSAPKIGNSNDLPDGISEEKYALAFKRNSKSLYPTVPTGNGFCLYIRRKTINMIGSLDEKAFPRGYGEENDFCMRARLHGWKNIIDDSTYVFHDRTKSFGNSKDELIKAGRKVIDERYKDYKKAIEVFTTSPLIQTARFFSKKALKECLLPLSILPRALYVVATQTGGTPQTNRDLMSSLQENFETWTLQSDSKELILSKYTLHDTVIVHRVLLKEAVEPLTHVSSEYDNILSSWLRDYQFDLVHIRHLAWHSLSLPRLAKESGSTVINSFHDFYTLCPTVKLLDNKYTYCNGKCTNGVGECQIELWSQDALPLLKDSWIHEWRKKFSRALMYCDAYITTSESARKTILDIYPTILKDNFYIIPHGRDFSFQQIPLNQNTFNILVPGNITIAKGWNIIVGLLKQDSFEKLHFHIIGNCNQYLDHPRLTFHGAYKREEFSEVIKKVRPTVGAVFSIWDETWCHTLTELWSVGLPVMVLDYGTVAQRVRESGAGWVYNDSDIQQLYSRIIKDLTNKESITKALTATKKWQETRGILHTNSFMASSYMQVYYKAMTESLNKKQTFIENKKIKNLKVKIAVVIDSNNMKILEKVRNSMERDFIYIMLTFEQLIIAIELEELSFGIIEKTILSEDNLKTLKSLNFNYIDSSATESLTEQQLDIKIQKLLVKG